MTETKSACTDWTAIHDFMAPGPAHLTVSGKCTFPTPGYRVTLTKKVPQRIIPAILLLEKTVTPPSGPQPDVVTTISVKYEEHRLSVHGSRTLRRNEDRRQRCLLGKL